MKWNNIIGKQNDQVCEIFRHFPKILQNSLALPIQPPEKQRQTTATTTPPMRPRPRNDEFVERLREFAINIYPSRKYHDYVYPQHSLLLRNRSSDQVWVHLGLIIIELDVQKQQQHQQKLTAIGMLSVAIIIIIAMNKFSSNYYFRHFCNVPVWCSMQ